MVKSHMGLLQPLPPKKAVHEYLKDREPEVTKSTLHEHRSRLKRFLNWCDEVGLDDMNDLDGRKAQEFKNYRAERVAITTLEHEMRTFRLMVAFCESIDGVMDGVANGISIPKPSRKEKSRDVKIEPDHAKAILNYLERWNYASLRHVMFHTLWETGIRTSTLRSFDLRDFYPNDPDGPYLDAVHRPESGTPLKKDEYSEREINISDELARLLKAYINEKRPEVTDDFDRHPLFATSHGRVYKTTIQRNVYSVTRPCHIGMDCPHGREPDECEAKDYNTASKCPDSVSPHAIRRGSATHYRNLGHSRTMVGDKLDMSEEVLREHYERQSKTEKRRQRRGMLDGF